MATLIEINTLLGERDVLFQKVRAAMLISAEAVRANGSATALSKAWAKRVFLNPDEQATGVYNAVIAANNTATITAIRGATDTQVQTAVTNVLSIMEL